MNELLQRSWKWIVALFFLGVSAIYQESIVSAFHAATKANDNNVHLAFNDVDRCEPGVLHDIVNNFFADSNIPLTNGAEDLRICDTESIDAPDTELPRRLATQFPACLTWRGKESGGLVLVRNSDAVCALPGGKYFLCDGKHARHFEGVAAIGGAEDAIKPCSNDTLHRFGFAS